MAAVATFRWQYFRQGLFPSKALSAIIKDYGSRYGDALAQNYCLGNQAIELLPHLNDAQRCLLVSKSGSELALDALLADPATSPKVLTAIGESWHLSVPDQHRLLDRDFDDHACRMVLGRTELTNYAVAIWKERFNYDPATHNLTVVKKSPKVSLPKYRVPWMDVNDASPCQRTTIAELSNVITTIAELSNVISGLYHCSGLINEQLGAGATPLSLGAWEAFLVLVGSNPDIQLESVLQTARRMAFLAA